MREREEEEEEEAREREREREREKREREREEREREENQRSSPVLFIICVYFGLVTVIQVSLFKTERIKINK